YREKFALRWIDPSSHLSQSDDMRLARTSDARWRDEPRPLGILATASPADGSVEDHAEARRASRPRRRPDWEREDRSVASTAGLIVVRRGEQECFERLRRDFAMDPSIRVIWDRRVAARRRQRRPVANDRRQDDRRAAPADSWTALGFVVAREG